MEEDKDWKEQRLIERSDSAGQKTADININGL